MNNEGNNNFNNIFGVDMGGANTSNLNQSNNTTNTTQMNNSGIPVNNTQPLPGLENAIDNQTFNNAANEVFSNLQNLQPMGQEPTVSSQPLPNIPTEQAQTIPEMPSIPTIEQPSAQPNFESSANVNQPLPDIPAMPQQGVEKTLPNIPMESVNMSNPNTNLEEATTNMGAQPTQVVNENNQFQPLPGIQPMTNEMTQTTDLFNENVQPSINPAQQPAPGQPMNQMNSSDNSGNTTNNTPEKSTKKKTHKGLIIIIIISVVAVLAAAGFFVVKQFMNHNPQEVEDYVETTELTCSKTSEDGNTSEEYLFEFDNSNNSLINVNAYKSISFTDDGASTLNTLNQESEQLSNSGITAEVNQNENSYNLTYNADEESFKKVFPDYDLSSNTNISASFTGAGYTCQ